MHLPSPEALTFSSWGCTRPRSQSPSSSSPGLYLQQGNTSSQPALCLHFFFFLSCLTFKSWCWFLRASIRVRVPNGFIGFFCFWCWWFLRFRNCIRRLLSCYRKQTAGLQMLHESLKASTITVAHLSLCFDAPAAC